MFRCTCPGSGPGSASKIYVGNLPSDVSKEVPWKSDLFEVPSETSVCQRYSNVSSALMGKELKDPLTFSDLFQTSHLHLSAQIRNSWCWFLQLRPVEDIHIMTGRWQMHCRFIYSIDSLSILAFCFISSCERSKSGQASAFVKYFGTGEVRNLEILDDFWTKNDPNFKRFKTWLRLRMR